MYCLIFRVLCAVVTSDLNAKLPQHKPDWFHAFRKSVVELLKNAELAVLAAQCLMPLLVH